MRTITAPGSPSLAEKVAFLSRPAAYGLPQGVVARRETHMSWVFLTGDKVYKLKKPVRFPYLDFSTLARREAACRAELALNRRLAPDVYEDVVALAQSSHGLSIGGPGEPVDWLVAMRRLDERETVENAILERRLEPWQLDRLVATLVQFYRRASAVFVSPAAHIAGWKRSLAYNRRVLLDPRLGLPSGQVRRIDHAQRRFLDEKPAILAERVRRRHIVDGHGDLRPEHIWPGDPVRIIDCLEFNRQLRAVDPFDEIAFLVIECERLGAAWAGKFARRERVVMLESFGKGILGTTLRYPYEVREAENYFEDVPDIKLPDEMKQLAPHILDTKRAEFEPGNSRTGTRRPSSRC